MEDFEVVSYNSPVVEPGLLKCTLYLKLRITTGQRRQPNLLDSVDVNAGYTDFASQERAWGNSHARPSIPRRTRF